MKAEELKTGDSIAAGIVQLVRPSTTPDRIIVEVLTHGKQEKKVLLLFKGSEVDTAEDLLLMDRESIASEFFMKLDKRLAYGEATYGPYWVGNDPLANLEEELLDAFVYLWIARRRKK